ncbi:MAG: cobalamin B12-binding domain-containing protein [Deltaproteobacteria bacterium]|nr:cobalamin B12-binding domain-containing protein [Deltaproteobacteria bacterium]
MERILLIQPNMKVATSGQRIVYPPLGIMYIASVLEQKGYKVRILDCHAEGLDRDVDMIDGYVDVGIPMDDVRKRIQEFRPDCVGISCNFSVMVASMNETAKLVKELFPKTAVIVGGNHASSMPEEVMENPCVDYVMVGESELTFPMLLNKIDQGIGFESVPGLVWRKDSGLIKNPPGGYIKDLDSLPMPAWHLFPYEKYSRTYKPHTVTWGKPEAMPSILTSRGCAGTCIFCSVHKTMGRKFRARNLDKVFEEIRFLVDKYHISKLMIVDDNFTHDRKRTKQFCDEFKKYNFGIEIYFQVLALWCMDEELIDKLYDIGCTHMGFALESGVQEVLTNIVKKPLKLDRAMELLRYAKQKGIHLTGTFVIGFPGETKKDIQRSLYMANYSGLFDSREIYIATPLPGSEMFDICKKNNLFVDNFSYSRVEVVKPNITTKDFTPEDIEVILEADRTHHLIKANPKHILRYIKGVWKRKPPLFFKVLWETLKMFVKYDFLKIKEIYP